MSSNFIADPPQRMAQRVIHVRRSSTNTHVEYIVSDAEHAHVVTWRFSRKYELRPESTIMEDMFVSWLEIGSCLR